MSSKRSPILLTESAKARVRFLLAQRKSAHPEKETNGIKINIKTKGCNGLKYVVEYADKIEKFDEIIKEADFELVIDGKALLYLIGTTMDYVESDLETGFVFINPNEKGRCGCGESFHV